MTDPNLFKCDHCKKRHVTGSYSCMKIKEQEKLKIVIGILWAFI